MSQITNSVVAIGGSIDQVATNDGTTLGNFNTIAQLSAAAASLSAVGNPSLAPTALLANASAFKASLDAWDQVLQDPNATREQFLAATLAVIGTAAGEAGATAQLMGAESWGARFDVAGGVITAASLGVDFDKISTLLANGITSVANTSGAITSAAGFTAPNATAAADAASMQADLSNAVNNLQALVQSGSTGIDASLAANLSNAFSAFNSDTQLTFNDNGLATQALTETATGVSSVSTTASNSSTPLASSQLFINSTDGSATVQNSYADGSGNIVSNGSAINYSGGSSPALAEGSSGLTANFGGTTVGGEVTVNGQTFSETLANTQVAIDAIGDVNFVDNTGNPLQTLAPTSDGGVTQSRFSSGVVDQLTQKNFLGSDGTLNGSVGFTYSTNPSDTWLSKAVITNGSGQTIGLSTTNKDGTSILENIDPTTGSVIVTTGIDAQGHTTQQTVNPSTNYPAFVQAIADTLATQLISSVLIKNNLPASIAAQAFADAVVHSALPTAGQNLTFAQDFAQSTFDIAGGIAGSQAGALVANALGLPSEFGTLTGGVAGNLVTQALVNDASQALGLTTSTTSVLTAANFAAGIGGAGGVAVGSALAGLLLTPTLAGEVTGAVASAGVLATNAELLGVLAEVNPAIAVLTAFSLAFGSDFVGNIIGDIFGGLFGGQPSVGPNATAIVFFDLSVGQQFFAGPSAADNGGDVTIAQSLANATISSLNSVLASIGGKVVGGTADFGLGYFKGLFFAADENDGNPNEYQQNQFANASDAVGNAAFRILHQIQIKGGNPYMEYALQHSTATNYAALINDLNVAHDYSLYIGNPLAFDLALAVSGDPNQLTTWQTELARAHTLGLDQLTAGDLQSITKFGTVVNPTSLANFETILGTGSNFSGTGETDYFVHDNATGQVSVVGFNGNGHVSFIQDLTNADGSVFTLASGSQIINTAQNLLGDGGNDLIIQASNGQASALEFDSTGKLLGTEAISAVVSGGSLSVTAANELVLASNATVTNSASGTHLLGSGNTISVADNETLNLNGSNNAITLGSSDTLNLNGGVADTVNSWANTINVAANAGVIVNGGGNAVSGANGANIAVEGNGQFGWADTVTVTGGKVNLNDSSSVEVVGSGNTITAVSNGHVGIDSGNNNNVTVGTNGNVFVQASDGNAINASGAVISLGTNVTDASIIGNNDSISAGIGDTLSVKGTGDTVQLQGIASTNVAVSRSNNDLVLSVNGSAKDVIQNYFLDSNHQVAGLQFSDGVTWTPQFVNSLFVTHSPAQATINGGSTLNLGNVRVGATDSAALSISNSATGAAEKLDASINAATGNATAAGSISQLTAGGTDTTDVTVGLNMASAGHKTGSVTLNLASDGTGVDNNGVTALASQTIQLNGNVYREAAASIASLPSNPILHVGDTVTENLVITNTAAADGFSENLTASVASATTGITPSGTTGDIAAQATSNAIHVGISTAQAGTVSGSVTLNLASDGAGVDGLSPASLSQQTVAVTATVNNFARAAFEEVSGGGTLTQNGNNYVLTYNLAQNASSAAFNLGVLNNVSGPSDLLSGNFTASGPSNFVVSGLGNFSGLNAGQADTAPTVTFNGTTPGSYTETITLHSSGSNASGYSGALTDETLTITVNIAAATPGATESQNVFGQIINLAGLSGVGTVLGTGASFDGSGNQSHFTRNATTGQVDVSEFDSSGTITFAEALTKNGSAFTVASGATLVDTAQNLLGSGGYDLVTQAGSQVTAQEFNAAGQQLTSHTETLFNVANGGSLSVTGANDLIIGSGATVTLGSNATAAFLHGNNDTVTLANNNDSLSLVGANDTINLGSSTGSSLNLNGGSSDTINSWGNVIHVASNAAATFSGGGNQISGANGASITLEGNGQFGWADTVTMTGGTVILNSDTSVEIVGSGNVIDTVGNGHVGIDSGNNNVVNINGANGNIFVEASTGTVINASGAVESLSAAGITNTSLIGNNNSISAVNGDTFNVTGTGDTITASNDTIYLNPNTTNITINGSNDTIHIRAGDTYTLGSGSTNDTVVTDTVTNVTNGSTVSNFNAVTSILDLTGLAYDSSITATPNLNAGHTAGTLVVTDHGVAVDTINLTNIASIGSFTVRSDGAGGTLLVDPLDAPSATDNPIPVAAMAHGNDGFVFADTNTQMQSAAHELVTPAHSGSNAAAATVAQAAAAGDQFIFHASAMTMPQHFADGLPDIFGAGYNPQQVASLHLLTQYAATLTDSHAYGMSTDHTVSATDPHHPANQLLAPAHANGFHLV